MIELRGMTWNHPRGLDPLVTHAREYEKQHDVRITWDARSLEEFEAHPLDGTQQPSVVVLHHMPGFDRATLQHVLAVLRG